MAQTDVLLAPVEMIDHDQLAILDGVAVQILVRIHDESAPVFGIFLVEPVEAVRVECQPEDRINADTHRHRWSQMGSEAHPVRAIDVDAFDGTADWIAEVEVSIVVNHRRDATEDVDENLPPATVHVPGTDQVTDPTLDEEHETQFRRHGDRLGAGYVAGQHQSLTAGNVTHHYSSFLHFRPVDVFRVRIYVETLDCIGPVEQLRLAVRFQVHRVDDISAQVAEDDCMTHAIERHSSDILDATQR